jgi:hypothetical protein
LFPIFKLCERYLPYIIDRTGKKSNQILDEV